MNNDTTREFPSVRQLNDSSNVNFKIIIPSTRNKNIYIGKLAWTKRVKMFNNYLSKRFGGSTTQRAVGNYLYRGKLIKEKVVIISVYTTQREYNKFDEELRSMIKQKKKAWGQDSMAFEYQDKLMFI